MESQSIGVGRVPAGIMLRRQRVAAGLIMLIFLPCVANYYLELGLFGRFAKQAMALSLLVTVIFIMRFGPSIFRLRAYQRLRRSQLSKVESQLK
jgi:hypothetical protein